MASETSGTTQQLITHVHSWRGGGGQDCCVPSENSGVLTVKPPVHGVHSHGQLPNLEHNPVTVNVSTAVHLPLRVGMHLQMMISGMFCTRGQSGPETLAPLYHSS